MRVLEHFHLHADVTGGHSYGELTALCAAGWIEAPSLHTLSHLRGRLMAEGTGDRGGMLAVRAPWDAVETVLREESLDLVLANRNAPNQTVLSGSSLEIVRAGEIFARRQIDSKPLPVAAAFHSPFVAPARKPFQDALEKIPVRASDVAVFANNSAGPYPRDAYQARRLLAIQLVEPVRFVEQIENMHRAGVRTFLEVGPANKLTGLVGAILEGKPHEALALDASSGKRPGSADLARVLAQLAALGHRVELSCWDAGWADTPTRAEKKPTLTVPICGANYVKPREVKAPSATSPIVKEEVKPISAVSTVRASAPSIAPAPVPPPPQAAMRKPMNETVPVVKAPKFAAEPTAVHQALAMTQENLAALQKLGEQTAQLHRQFLEGQDRALQVFQSLLEQQHRLIQTGDPAMTPPSRPTVLMPRPTAPQRAMPEVMPTPPPVTPHRNGAHSAFVAPVADSRMEATLLDVVAAKTGYPAEMLQLDMELDTDLGIDSIKRVEIFALLQEKLPDAPPVKAEHLGTLRTLRQVVSFLGNGHENVEDSLRDPSLGLSGAKSSTRTGRLAVFLDVVAQKTGYPPEMLQLDMELDTDLGIDSIKRVEIFSLLQEKLPDAPTVKAEHLGTLRTIQQVIDFIAASPGRNGSVAKKDKETRGQGDKETGASSSIARLVLGLQSELDEQAARESVALPDGEIWITAEDEALATRIARRLDLLGQRARLVTIKELPTLVKPDRLAGLVLLAPPGPLAEAYLLDAFRLLQFSAAGLRNASGAVFATIARLDGSFGLSGLAANADPLTGGLAGLSKTARHEWPEVHCKALDLAPGWDDMDEAAFAIVEELLLAGPVEVGVSPGGRCTLERTPAPFKASQFPLESGDVVVITGGARGVTAETAVALARTFAPMLVLFGRSPAPSQEPAWLAPLTTESDIKRALLAQSSGRATPKDVGEQHRALTANREMLRTIDRIEKAGGTVVYRQVDVRDSKEVAAAIAGIRRDLGPIKGLVHGAGVLADRLIVDKTVEQFATVYATKVVGLQCLLDALRDDDLRVLALFSSSTGRFGRTGQVDYAVANEVLNKLAQREASRRPRCRVVAFNWGPWDGGMVNASLKKVFAEEGVGVIPLQEGAEFFVHEISQAAGGPVEVVVLGELPGQVKTPSGSADTVAFERELTVEAMPVLASHVIKGRPVMPVALIVEWLAHGAMHANPGLAFHGFNDLQILKGIILHDDKPLPLSVLTGKAIKEKALYRIPMEIRSTQNSREVLHVRAEIVLAASLPQPGDVADLAGPAYPRGKAEIYRELLFHGSDLHGIEYVECCTPAGIVAAASSAPAPAAWVGQPMRSAWLADPLVLDCGFQMMIVWSCEQYGAGSLPCAVASYRQYRRAFPQGQMRIVAHVTRHSEHRALADLDFIDTAGQLIARMIGCECVIDASLNQAFRGNQMGLNATPSS